LACGAGTEKHLRRQNCQQQPISRVCKLFLILSNHHHPISTTTRIPITTMSAARTRDRTLTPARRAAVSGIYVNDPTLDGAGRKAAFAATFGEDYDGADAHKLLALNVSFPSHLK
jgi:hypothetical protein